MVYRKDRRGAENTLEESKNTMFNNHFGIEVEFTGITRTQAEKVAAEYLGGTISEGGDYYDTKKVTAPDGRVWKFMFDSSIKAEKKENGRIITATDKYKVELVSPILSYHKDIDTIQELIRRLRKAGGFANSSTGIHIHLDGSNHTPKSLRNFINIIASKNDLFYKALQIEPDRMRFCKKMDEYLVERMNSKKPQTFKQIENIWYEGYGDSRNQHYHQSRYHFFYG